MEHKSFRKGGPTSEQSSSAMVVIVWLTMIEVQTERRYPNQDCCAVGLSSDNVVLYK